MKITMEMLEARPLSFSSLMAFKRSPLHYIHYLAERRGQTPAMVMGSLIDCLLLTPDEYEARFVVQPDFSKGEGVREKARIWKEENKGKMWIKEDQLAEAKLICESVSKNPVSKEKISKVTQTQNRIKWTDKETGLPMIAILDMEADTFISDLKSTLDAHPDEFMKSAANYDYFIQAAIYMEAMKHRGKFPDFFFIAVEKSAPYGVSVLKATGDFLQLGKQQYEKLLQEFKFCMENNMWDLGYEFRAAAGYYQLDLPGYVKNKLEKYA